MLHLQSTQFIFGEERTTFFFAEEDLIFALVGIKFHVRSYVLRIKFVSFLVDENVPARSATLRVTLGAVAFEFVYVLRLKVKIFFLHNVPRKFFRKEVYHAENFLSLDGENFAGYYTARGLAVSG